MAMTGGAIGSSAIEQSAAADINNRLSQLHSEMSTIADRMQRVIDRAFGSTPEANSKVSQPKAVPVGEIGSIRERLEDLFALTAEQSRSLNRIDTIV